MKKYIPSEIEPKWQRKWEEDKLYKVDLDKPGEKYYLLVEFTYPSGDLHIGHWFAFAVPDVLGRFKRMQGYNVFFPNGFDAFGLPAENAAIQRRVHPKDWTLINIENMKKQFSLMGAIHNFDNEVITCLPDYYIWNQWIFLKMLEKGIAYKGRALANWCPKCQTVLANENVENGKCWRCEAEVIQKEVEQWFLKITDYAERLLWKEAEGGERSRTIDWPKPIREGQNNWIGKSEGIILDFDGMKQASRFAIKVFTTRPETTDGATFLVLAPEHPLVSKFTTNGQKNDVESYIKAVEGKSELERKENREKTGVSTGSFVNNPVSGKKIPIWVADYVLMGYGTGAIMAVPYADERDKQFAQKFKLPIIETSFKASPAGQKQVNYHLHDWSISRQRYWGTPIPIINCPKCGSVPVPQKDLPVELPYEVDWAPKGKPPLATAESWVNIKCPKCGGEAKREVETMDTFVDSSWYFLRYLDYKNRKVLASKKRLKDWMLVDIYFGGAEHTLGHTLYSRFFVKFLKDIGVVDFEEYAKKRVNHGVILGPDGARMSKSHGNVVNPDEQIKSFGADAVRLYLCFIGPYDIVAPWNPGGIHGVYHFLQRVWGLLDKVQSDKGKVQSEDLRIMHKTIKKVTEDIEAIKFNTAVASLMEWLNYLSAKVGVQSEEYKTFLLLLAPFAPHITEELWSQIGEKYSIHKQSFPKFANKYLEEEEIAIVVQVNGRVRDMLMIQKDIVNNKEIVQNLAKKSEKVKRFLDNANIKRIVYVSGKIINFVI